MIERSIYSSIHSEYTQNYKTRLHLFDSIEKSLKRPLVTLFTSFRYSGTMLDDDDADMLQDILQRTDLKNGLALMVSSPGGVGLAAERIVNICRAFSGTGDYWAIVPSKAKSAATVICMGASKIFMSPASELGPVDPQIFREERGQWRYWSAYNLVSSYKKLFQRACKAKGRLEPFMQQLANYDERDIETWTQQILLSNDIAVKVLKTGQMQKIAPKRIERKIQVFLNPAAGTKVHGRPIYRAEAAKCGLAIEDIDISSPFWQDVYELYLRTDFFVTREASKAVESRTGRFLLGPPRKPED